MSTGVLVCITFVCIFGGALLAIGIASVVPDHHRSGDSRDVLKLGIGMIATLSALVLGLLVATAKETFDAETNAIKHMATKVILLDRVLAWYGTETQEARTLLRRSVTLTVDRLWPSSGDRTPNLKPGRARGEMEAFFEKVAALPAEDDAQRMLKAEALSTTTDVAETRLQLFIEGDTSIPLPFLIVLTLWLTVLFVGYGLLAPRNPTVIIALFVCTLSVSGAIFLILELSRPFDGYVRVSGKPLQDALAHLGE